MTKILPLKFGNGYGSLKFEPMRQGDPGPTVRVQMPGKRVSEFEWEPGPEAWFMLTPEIWACLELFHDDPEKFLSEE